jgi:hypothetical protein
LLALLVRMKRRVLLALFSVVAVTIPAMLSALLLFGCCVLPFHRVIHRVIPLCHLASAMLQGGRADSERQPAPPAPTKQQLKPPPLITTLTSRQVFDHQNGATLGLVDHSPAAHRSFIALGALRCDDDVGVQRLLLQTFRI